MPLTPATLADDITAMLAAYKLYDEEFQDWLTGTVGGGVALDGRYPLTSRLTGVTRQTLCPAQLEDNVTGAVGQAQTAQTAAEAAKTAAETAETNAETAETNALAHKTAAVAAQSAAEAAQSAAENAAVNALAQANNAAASYDAFDDRYLGVFTTAGEPTVDNDGDALVAGALYWNSDLGKFKVYSGSAWGLAFDLSEADNFTWTGLHTFDQYLSLTPMAAPAHTEGRLWYDSGAKALSYYNDEADVTVNLGQEVLVRVRNVTGVLIPNGSVVYVSGATGASLPNVALAQANSAATAEVLGIVTHDIENNSNGYVTVVGDVNDVDTSAWTAGTELFLSDSVAGGLTSTKPTLNDVRVGYVTVSNVSVGSIKVQVGLPVNHNHPASEITSGTFADARIAESNVTQHQAALTITESQISDLTHVTNYLTNDASDTMTSSGATTLRIDGDGAGYHNGAVRFIANHASNARALGNYAYNSNDDTEWFWGRPYPSNDEFNIVRATGNLGESDSTASEAHANSTLIFRIGNDGTIYPQAGINASDLFLNKVTQTANNSHDIVMFGSSDSAAQAGAFYSKLKIFGGSGQTRDLQLFQVPSGNATISSSYTLHTLDFTNFVGITIPATCAFYLDGGFNTYLTEQSSDSVALVVGGVTKVTHSTSQTNFYNNTLVIGNDSANPGLYLDASVSGAGTIYFRQNNAAATRIQSLTDRYVDIGWYATTQGGMRFYDGDNAIQGYVYSDGAATPTFGFLTSGGAWAVKVNTTNTVLASNGTNALATSGANVTVYGTLDLANTTDTTLSRLSAGRLGVEGKAVIKHNGAYTSGEVTVSTSAPSGGSNGDIWLKY